ncbi:hypothetical protein BC834DRAFT_908815 [Gloeopeniophorella convolvens]|nr:hypothetical protein BC834DRAFT_908815 [Gloeopeniophorella convolvens]
MPPRPARPDPPLHSPANYALHALPPTLLSYALGTTTLRRAAHKVCPAPALAALMCAAFVDAHWVPVVVVSARRAHVGTPWSFAGATVVRVPELCGHDVHFWAREHGAGAAVRRVCAWRQRRQRSGCYRAWTARCPGLRVVRQTRLRVGSARLRVHSHVRCVEHVGVCMHCIVSLS